VPLAANLAQGELAINITDGKLYYEDNAGVVQVIATKGAGTIGGTTTQIQYNNAGALAGNAAMTFNSGTSTTTLTTLNLTNALGATYGGTAQSAYTQGDVLYASATNTLAKLGIGTVNYILTSTGTVPQWVAPSSITVNTATNLAGGLGGSVPYQSALDTTTFLAIGAANRVMTSTGSAPQWVTSLTGLTGVSSSSITNTSLTSGRVVVSSTAGLQADDADLTFDGTTLSAGGFSTTGLSTLVKTVKIGDSSFSGTAVFAAATPAKLYIGTGTVTDATSAIGATNATGAVASLAITPIAATNTSVTYTNASTLYIAGAPSAGTNITITNPYSLYVNAGAAYFGGAVTVAGSLSLAAVTVTSLSDSGNLTFTGTGNRITGDFSNATVASNVIFQTSTVNSGSYVRVMPNGTSTVSGFQAYASGTDPDNTSNFQIRIGLDNNQCILYSNRTGTGTYLPMAFNTSGTDKLTIAADATGTITIGGTAPRITGDFSNATFASRVAFQTSTVNGATQLSAIPNGTGTVSTLQLYNNSDIANSSRTNLAIISTEARLSSDITGTGTYLPMTFYTGGSESVRIGSGAASATDKGTVGIGYTALTGVGNNGLAVLGNVGIGTSSPGYKLTVAGASGSAVVNLLETGVRSWAIRAGGAATNTFDIADLTAAATRMTIDSSGNVGIGTTSPSSLLDLTGNDPTLRFTDNAGSPASTFSIRSTDGTLKFRDVTNSSDRVTIDSSGNLLVISAAGLGYGTGSGGTVTQATSKSTGVTLNKPTGQITMNNAALAGNTAVVFRLNDSLIASVDTVIYAASGNGNYEITTHAIFAGAVDIRVTNATVGSLSEALVINFSILKGATS
jgi:hypothetical protein